MITTSTQTIDFTEKQTENSHKDQLPEFSEPSAATIDNILRFSKSLEVRKSAFIKEIEFVKS